MDTRKPYPSDVSEEEWTFLAPYLALVREDAPQREHDLHEVFNGLRWVVRTGSAWRYMPHDLPRWEAVYQQTQRWLKAGVFEEMIHDLRVLLRLSKGENFGADGGHSGLSHVEVDPRERLSGRLRRTQEQEGLEGACCGGHFGRPARCAREPGQRGRPKGAREALRGDTKSDRGERRVGLRRSGMHGREGLRVRRRARHPTRSGQA